MVTLKKYLMPCLFAASFGFLTACNDESDLGLSETVIDAVQTSAPVTAIEEAEPVATMFSVVTYNVENLFDVDGVAMFDDYKQCNDNDPTSYTRAKFLTKMQNIAKVLGAINEGAGPEIILFQELEADFTPDTAVSDFDAFLDQYSGTTVEAMLCSNWSENFAGYPASAWLLKALADAGLEGYAVVDVPSHGMDSGVAHTNAVFSKFPIVLMERYRLVQARDILEVELDVEGHPLHVYVNHWKSGASNLEREPIRVENAKVLRALLDARLKENPAADIIVAGDLNSHYNHSILYPDIETGINDALGSSGSESFDGNDLYNLWFELPPEERYSEVWRGRRGSLMHKLITPGLYDDAGISYVDGSFNKLVITDLNADAIGRPLDWNDWGLKGGGASDHLPIVAQFKVGPFVPSAPLSKGDDALTIEMPLGYAQFASQLSLEDGAFISSLPENELGEYMGHMYTISTTVAQNKPFRLELGDKEWPIYVPDPTLRKDVFALSEGADVDLVVTFGQYRGKAQFVIEAIR